MILDYETLKVIWWLLIGLLIVGFVLTDGFDLGIGALLPFIGRNDEERRVILNTIGPTWEGNQVWLVTAAGALFAAWPLVYATVFSALYAVLLLILFALFFRPVGFDFRSKLPDPRWRNAWDWGLFVGGAIPAFVFGVVFGNILQGIPFYFDSDLRSFYTGTFWQLFNPFALLVGSVSLSMLIMHGAVFLQLRTVDNIANRSRNAVFIFGSLFLLTFALAGFWVAYGFDGYHVVSMGAFDAVPSPLTKVVEKINGGWMSNYQRFQWLWLAPTVVFVGGGLTIFLSSVCKPGCAFIASAASLSAVIVTLGFSMYPFLLPSSSHPASSLTIWDSSSSFFTLRLLFWVTLFFLPIVILYTSWAYRVMRGKVTVEKIRENEHTAY